MKISRRSNEIPEDYGINRSCRQPAMLKRGDTLFLESGPVLFRTS